MGRLDHLVEAVYERFKDRYFKDESTSWLFVNMSSTPNPRCLGVLVDLSGTK